MPRAHPFLSAAPRRNPTKPADIVFSRDTEANSQLEKALRREGFSDGTSVLNFPPEKRQFDLLPLDQLFKVQIGFFEKGDALIQTTRPPISDAIQDDRKKVEPSNSDLERAIFNHWSRYFDFCARSEIILSPQVASLLPPGYRDRERMIFHQTGCRFKQLQERGRRESQLNPAGERTAAFLLRVAEIYPGGPGLVGAFGLNAISTLAWCRLLREKYPYLLQNRGLSMVELNPAKVPARPMTYGFTDD